MVTHETQVMFNTDGLQRGNTVMCMRVFHRKMADCTYIWLSTEGVLDLCNGAVSEKTPQHTHTDPTTAHVRRVTVLHLNRVLAQYPRAVISEYLTSTFKVFEQYLNTLAVLHEYLNSTRRVSERYTEST